MAKKSSAPAALGSKEIPEGSPNCLEVKISLTIHDLSIFLESGFCFYWRIKLN